MMELGPKMPMRKPPRTTPHSMHDEDAMGPMPAALDMMKRPMMHGRKPPFIGEQREENMEGRQDSPQEEQAEHPMGLLARLRGRTR